MGFDLTGLFKFFEHIYAVAPKIYAGISGNILFNKVLRRRFYFGREIA
jgi:hypothetical protein